MERGTIMKKENTAQAKAKEVKKVIDISPLLAKMPDTFTPALLDQLFNLNDGGKTVRRHLRKNFAEELAHAYKDKWVFAKTQTTILTYFAERYAYDLKVLEIKPEPKSEPKAKKGEGAEG